MRSQTVPFNVGLEVPVAAPTTYIEGTKSSLNNVQLLQMCPVAELSHTQNDESVSKDVMVFSCILARVENVNVVSPINI